MDKPGSCQCERIDARPGPGPFHRILALDYYDGPTSGVAECGRCGACYRFEMLDWDDRQEIRVVSLARLPPGSLERIAAACPDPPSWPLWVPTWAFPTDAAREEADQEVEEVLGQAAIPQRVAAWTRWGDTQLVARELEPAELSQAREGFWVHGQPTRDWFTLLGLPRRKSPEAAPDGSSP